MIALITGASSGLGLEVSKILAQKGYDIIGVSRHEGDFSKLKDTYPNRKFEFISLDLSSEEGVKSLIGKTKYRYRLFLRQCRLWDDRPFR